MDLVETLLPGVGIRYELTTRSGILLGIVVQRDHRVEVAVYDRRDPDRAIGVVELEPDEVEVVAEVLGAPRLTQRFADLSREVPGLESARFQVREGTAFAGRPLGDTKARTRTGCSIVAIVCDSDVIAAPGPSEILHVGDVLVVIGAAEGLAKLDAILSTPS